MMLTRISFKALMLFEASPWKKFVFFNDNIQQKFRTRGGYHPVPSGRMDLLRGLFKACQTFGFGAWPRNPKLLNFNCFSFEADLLFEKPNVVFCAFNCIPFWTLRFEIKRSSVIQLNTWVVSTVVEIW